MKAKTLFPKAVLRLSRKATILAAAVLAAGCSQQLSGTYSDRAARPRFVTSITFVSGNKATIADMEIDYKVEGNKLKLMYPMGMTMVYPIKEDGSIEISPGERLYKHK